MIKDLELSSCIGAHEILPLATYTDVYFCVYTNERSFHSVAKAIYNWLSTQDSAYSYLV